MRRHLGGLPDRGILFLLFLRCLIDFENEGMRRDSESGGWFLAFSGSRNSLVKFGGDLSFELPLKQR